MSTPSVSGRRVFVTGADGFIGSHLAELLVASGAEVRALVYYNSWNQIGWLRDTDPKLRAGMEIVTGDVRDAERMRELVRDCDYVFHLASLIAIPYSYSAPRSYVETNIGGAINVLEAARAADRIIRLVHVSTSEVYGTAQTVPIAESHPLVGQSPYSASKIGADKIAESYHLSFGLPVTTARPFNTFGPRQTARAVIPTIASQLLSGAKTIRLGALHPTRDFNYVSDTVAGLLALALCDEAVGCVVNIGSGQEWSIAETVRLLCDLVGREVAIVTEDTRIRPNASEVLRLLADTTRLRTLTGWTSRVLFRDGLDQTVAWIAKNLAHFEVDKYSQ